MILTIKAVLAAQVLDVSVWSGIVLDSSRWRLTIPTYTDPQVSGLRSIERQKKYIANGKSKWRGPPSKSMHGMNKSPQPGVSQPRGPLPSGLPHNSGEGQFLSWSFTVHGDAAAWHTLDAAVH